MQSFFAAFAYFAPLRETDVIPLQEGIFRFISLYMVVIIYHVGQSEWYDGGAIYDDLSHST